jgi:crossover junction endodeoxyribonuclease RusA
MLTRQACKGNILERYRLAQSATGNNDGLATPHSLQRGPMQAFEFLVPKRPVSLQAKSRKHLQAWKAFVRGEAEKVWPAAVAPMYSPRVRITIVYLCEGRPADVDNIVKPILDALVGLVIMDDLQVTDIDSHRRFLVELSDAASLPPLLQRGIASNRECVYVRVSAGRI